MIARDMTNNRFFKKIYSASVFTITLSSSDSMLLQNNFKIPYQSLHGNFKIYCSETNTANASNSTICHIEIKNQIPTTTTTTTTITTSKSPTKSPISNSDMTNIAITEENVVLGFGQSCMVFINEKSAEHFWSHFIIAASANYSAITTGPSDSPGLSVTTGPSVTKQPSVNAGPLQGPKQPTNLSNENLKSNESIKKTKNLTDLKTAWYWESTEKIKQTSPLNEKIFELPKLKIKCFEGRCQLYGYCQK